jgi:exopolysaccharide production protein ExoZ
VTLGDSSYSLYLVHPFVVPAVGKLWLALHLSENISPALLFAVAFTLSLAAGHASYLAIEKPVTRWLLRTWKSPAAKSDRLVNHNLVATDDRS